MLKASCLFSAYQTMFSFSILFIFLSPSLFLFPRSSSHWVPFVFLSCLWLSGSLVVAKLYQSGKSNFAHVSDEPPQMMSGYGKFFFFSFRGTAGHKKVSEVPLVGSGPRFRLLGIRSRCGVDVNGGKECGGQRGRTDGDRFRVTHSLLRVRDRPGDSLPPAQMRNCGQSNCSVKNTSLSVKVKGPEDVSGVSWSS